MCKSVTIVPIFFEREGLLMEKMERRYGLPTAIATCVGVVIGSGIFFKTEAVLKVTKGNVLTGVIALAIMGVLLFFCSYSFSLLAQRYEKVNGVVDYAEMTMGPGYAYYVGCFLTFIYTPAVTGCLAWVTSMYFCELMGFDNPAAGPECLAIAGLIIAVEAYVNALAPKLSGKLQVAGTVIKLIPLTLMAIVGIAAGLSNGQLAANLTRPAAAGSSPVSDLTAATVSLAFVFEGWILSTSINSEVRDAKKNMPKALITSAIFIVAIYISYFLGICGSISIEDLMASSSTAAFTRTFGNVFGRILNIFIFISCLCTTHGLMIANARNIYSIAVRGQGPHHKVFAHVDPVTKMPINSALFGTMISMVWLVYFFGANVLGTWFGPFAFDSSELPIVNLYAFYIPIFIKMYGDKSQSFFNRFVAPTMSLLSCIFLIACAFYTHGIEKYRQAAASGGFSFPVLFYLIVFAAVMLYCSFFRHGSSRKS